MDLKKLQKKVDKGIAVLSDNDDKKNQERYINLRNKVEEVQEYIDKGIYEHDISLEMYNELIKCIKEFEKDRFIFILFLIILCGLLFVGVFYITYSHMYDHWHPHPGGNIKPPHHTKTTSSKKTTEVSTSSTASTKKTTTSVSNKTTATTTTQAVLPEDNVDPSGAFVTLVFDDSDLIDLNNIYPMLDSDGIKNDPTKWSLTSSLVNSSKDYILTYYVDFVDSFGNVGDENFINQDERLDVNKLKYQLLIKKNNQIIYDTNIQDMYDYPEAEEGIRPILSGQTMNNDQSLDFELRMWLDSSAGNDQQGKKYRFKIDVYYEFEFID